MNENINLCEILKSCPINTGVYSPMIGNCKLSSVNSFEVVVANPKGFLHINPDATATLNGYKTVELMLFPSQTQRDWSKWKCPKPKFDPKTFKAFDKVLSYSYNNKGYKWVCKYFSHLDNNRCYFTCGAYNEYCIPYNEETKYLVGLTEAAPKYYRYWED